MTQIPALFLPKKSTHRKVEKVEKIKEVQNKNKTPDKKVPILLKGRIDGHKENNSQVHGATRGRVS